MKQLVFISLLLSAYQMFGINKPVNLLNVCLNTSDSTVSLSWKSSPDDCASFTKHEIFGRKLNNPYAVYGEIFLFGIEAYTFKISDFDPSWSFFIKTSSDCSGDLSFYSDTIKMDLLRPSLMGIDSVSISPQNQLMVGWQKSKDADAWGYRLYKNTGGINDSIFNTLSTFALLKRNIYAYIGLAPYDSCKLFAPISTPHKATKLNGIVKGCEENIQLSWSLYEGWPIGKQNILLDTGNGIFYTYQILDGQQNSLLLENFPRGKTIRAYLRSYKSSALISSSSNIIQLETKNLRKPQNPLILRVSTVSNDSVLIELGKLRLQHDAYWKLNINSQAVASGENIYTDSVLYFINENIGLRKNLFQLVSYNNCDELTGISKIHQNILLTVDGQQLKWNDYVGWQSIEQSYLQFQEGFTWNNMLVLNENTKNLIETKTQLYRVKQNNGTLSSYSNRISNLAPFAVFYPNSLNAHSQNNKLVFYGPNIDLVKSRGKVYNRWGQLIGDFALSEPNFFAHEYPAGVYHLYLFLVDPGGKKKTEHQALYIIK